MNVTRVSSPNEVFASFNVTSKNAALMQRIRVRTLAIFKFEKTYDINSQVPVNDVYKVETCGTGLGQAMVAISLVIYLSYSSLSDYAAV